ncbi:hypothetical protein BLL52_4289 [Rhodoferax antarcticus ANT.BR]|uniref:Uncharacterized protein n=1 Tax=Rhodoferax antarcticus ANT.BR TaxID=1111071 RepID=A0A1Q8Y9E4_9BURK|nr:hypothetical protein BLL52_4289 [Rhodoferax antarcticus ANT.BR]
MPEFDANHRWFGAGADSRSLSAAITAASTARAASWNASLA